MTDAARNGSAADEGGMDYLDKPLERLVRIYLPLIAFTIVLLFPFYFMTTAAFRPDQELLKADGPEFLWITTFTLENLDRLFLQTPYPRWFLNTMLVTIGATFLSLFCSVCAAYGIEKIRYRGARFVGVFIFFAYLVPPSILFIPLSRMVVNLGLWDSPFALILTYPTILIPFSTWLLMGYFRTIPYELEECAIIDGANRFQILWRVVLPLAVPGLISAGIFAFTLAWNEYLYALVFISSAANKTAPVGIVTELIEGDLFRWGSLMAGALFGSLPVAILYSFFVEHYVSSMTGAVKE